MYHLRYLRLLAYCDLPTHIVMCFCFVLFASVLCLFCSCVLLYTVLPIRFSLTFINIEHNIPCIDNIDPTE
jgi:hypothetical protein